MAEIGKWWQAHRPTTRRLAQLYCALLYNANLKGFVQGKIYTGSAKALCVPGLNCYSCPGAVGACPLGALQNALAATGTRAGTYVLGILLLYGIILGRTVCGWLCPVGLIQELLHKIPTPKLRKSRFTRALTWLKYVILVVFVIAVPLWYGLGQGMAVPGFCKYICPAGTSEGAVALLAAPSNDSLFGQLGALFTGKFVIMLAVALACVFCWRAFCRFLCPLGAIYSLFNRFAVIGVRVEPSKCTHCGQCVRACPMDIRRVSDRECISCGRCVNVCSAGAIAMKAGKITLKGPDIPREQASPAGRDSARRGRMIGRVVWGVALIVLAFALVWFNILKPAETAQPEAAVTAAPAAVTAAPAEAAETDSPQIGYEVGDRLEDFTIATVSGDAFHLADCHGHVTFINLWATWCGPCVQELPEFARLQAEHPDVRVLAVHSSFGAGDAPRYLEEHPLDLTFALDTDGSVYRIVGGDTMLPQTIVLNARGEVVYNMKSRVTYEKLEALLEQADAGE